MQPRAEQDRLMALHDAAQDAWFNRFLDGFFAGLPDPGARRSQAPLSRA